MANIQSKDQLNEEQQSVEMSLQEWVQVIKENREELLGQVLKIEGEKEDVDAEMQMREIISTNPVVDNLMKIAEEELGKYQEALAALKTLEFGCV